MAQRAARKGAKARRTNAKARWPDRRSRDAVRSTSSSVNNHRTGQLYGQTSAQRRHNHMDNESGKAEVFATNATHLSLNTALQFYRRTRNYKPRLVCAQGRIQVQYYKSDFFQASNHEKWLLEIEYNLVRGQLKVALLLKIHRYLCFHANSRGSI